MNREQLQALVKALEVISPSSRRDAFDRAMRVLDGAATIDDGWGVLPRKWGTSTSGKWGTANK